MKLRGFLILALIYLTSFGIVVAQNSEITIPKEVIKKAIFQTKLVKFLHFELAKRKTLYIRSKPHLNFKSIEDTRVKIKILEPESSVESSNIIEIVSWQSQNGVFKLSLTYDIEGVVSWFKLSKKDGEWKLLDSSIAET